MAKNFNKVKLYEGGVRKITRQGCSKRSKGMKKYRGQGGPRKRCKLPK
tara:strand:- start:16 stop:159 length:144 start_codon:yes stop_codon:yes gene_type:complete